MRRTIAGWFAVMIGVVATQCGVARGQSITNYHASPDRSGHYVFAGLTWSSAARLHLDSSFDGQVDGNIYAQPLYWQDAQNNRRLIVATENNNVYALDAASGKVVWQRSLGQPVALSSLPCGDINPLGITGTPAIEPAQGAVYLDAVIKGSSGPQHYLFGLSLADGSILSGFPVNVAEALKAAGRTFDPKVQNQRGALLIVNRTLFIPYGGHFGDCGAYHGWILGMSLDNPAKLAVWSTRAQGGGIWAPGGIAYDGSSMFATTGNTFGVSTWSDGEAVFRFDPTLGRQSSPRDFFAPHDWKYLDGTDLDLGGTGPVPIDVTDTKGSAHFILALGKDGKAYLLRRNNLGGIGGALVARPVSRDAIRTAPAVWAAADSTLVAFQGRPAPNSCPGQVANAGLTVLRIKAHPPRLSTAWCAPLDGRGAPIVTTLADGSNPIVWVTGAEGDNLLHGFRGDNGTAVFGGGEARMEGLRHFGTILAADGRLYVPADGRIYSFIP
jgi:outer membrane protein assembly factor BamB